MAYNIKTAQEAAWAALYAAIAYVTQLQVDPDTVRDWRTYGIAVGVGIARVAVAAALNRFTRKEV